MAKFEEIVLENTCGACPEQYDAFYNGEYVGYLRLRNGKFTARHNSNIVYESETIGDGMFDYSERKKHLKRARKAIYKSIKTQQ